MDIAIAVLLVVLLVAVLLLLWDNRRQTEARLEAQRTELNQGLANTQQTLQQSIVATQQAFGQRIEGLDQRFSSMQSSITTAQSAAQETITRVDTRLGELSQASQRILEVGKDISALQDILKPPKLRGGFGELLLENLLGQILPSEHFHLQYRFRNGTIVDAAIQLVHGIVPVDSKFPLESFSRMLATATDEERSRLRRDFLREVRGHVDAVAKYILPDEGTLEFALMYIPAENVYYETIVKDDVEGAGPSLASYAMERHVFPVSPSTFYAFLMAIAYGLKGLQVEERAKEIIGHLQRLDGDFKRFRREFDILGGHISDAKNKYDKLGPQAERFGERLAQPLHARWTELAPGEQLELPPG